MQLDKLKVSRVDDGFLAGSADEPYLWLIAAKVDGTTIFENSPGTATVAVLSTSAAPGNLGPASQGVESGRTIAIPKSVGRIDTTLRGTTGGVDIIARLLERRWRWRPGRWRRGRGRRRARWPTRRRR